MTDVEAVEAEMNDPDAWGDVVEPPSRGSRPSYAAIASAVQAVLDCGLYELELRQDGKPVADPVWRLAKALERAGLIDARGVGR